mmetsp:Transcript_748/g.1882  ORF Transcript_748/g.1882 Transcript_748/m.1882 type:complete len:169 (-) Transcript_748:100-606(-)
MEAVSAGAAAAAAPPAAKANAAAAKPLLLSDAGVALGGLDPVSYRRGDAPAQGDAGLAVAAANGATYHFATEENKQTFEADQEKYIPMFGGYCATAMSEGKVFPANPESFHVDPEDDKLYVFFRGEVEGNLIETLPRWMANKAEFKKLAMKNWAEDAYDMPSPREEEA